MRARHRTGMGHLYRILEEIRSLFSAVHDRLVVALWEIGPFRVAVPWGTCPVADLWAGPAVTGPSAGLGAIDLWEDLVPVVTCLLGGLWADPVETGPLAGLSVDLWVKDLWVDP